MDATIEVIFPSMVTYETIFFLLDLYSSFKPHKSRAEDIWATVGKALFQPVVNLNYLESPPVEQTELSALSEVPR